MRFNRLDLNLLVALDAMLTERNVSRSADRMHMTQSAMSNALNRLRGYFDDDLLVPMGRGMELTPRAEFLRSAVRDVLVRIEASITTKPMFDPAHSDRKFRIFVSDYTMGTLIPHMLALAHRQSKSVRFDLLPQVAQPQRALEQGEADLLIIPTDFCSPDHPAENLFSERFLCIAWSEGRYATGPLTLDDYGRAGHVIMQPPGGAPSFETSTIRRLGIERRTEVSTFSFAGIPPLIVGTDRLATVHAQIAGQASLNLPLAVHEPPFEIPAMQQAMQWHRHRTQDPGLIWLRELLAASAEKMMSASVRH